VGWLARLAVMWSPRAQMFATLGDSLGQVLAQLSWPAGQVLHPGSLQVPRFLRA